MGSCALGTRFLQRLCFNGFQLLDRRIGNRRQQLIFRAVGNTFVPWGEESQGKEAVGAKGKHWFRDLDSNQDTQLQRLMSYRLDDPGNDDRSVAEAWKGAQAAREARGRCARCGAFC